MSQDEQNGTDRRAFLQASAAATAAALAMTPVTRADEPKPASASKPVLPKRTLGKTGVDVTMLTLGTVKFDSVTLLQTAYTGGIRYFDTAHSYRGAEAGFKEWFQKFPEVRKDIFLVTKDERPHKPADLLPLLDERLAALGTDHIDLVFYHALGDHHPADEAIAFPKSKEFAEAVEAIKKSGKAKFVGFSTHHKNKAEILKSAAEGGIADAIMVQYSPWLDKDSPMNKALDACHKANIGLISMKQIAGRFQGDKILQEVAKRVPFLKDRNLSAFQGLLTAIWSDERIATACVSMHNTDHIRENIDAARRFEPIKEADIFQLRDAVLAHNPTLCTDCDGRCSIAAGTKAELGNLTRFLTYHEHHGMRGEARRHYAELDEAARDWSGADLAAATEACMNGLDFAKLLPEVEKHLA